MESMTNEDDRAYRRIEPVSKVIDALTDHVLQIAVDFGADRLVQGSGPDLLIESMENNVISFKVAGSRAVPKIAGVLT